MPIVRFFIVFFFSAFPFLLGAQNLVPNGSFEAIDSCPNHFHDIEEIGWGFWLESPNVFNSCSPMINQNDSIMSVPQNGFGYQEAASGAGYIGLYGITMSKISPVDWREIIGREMEESMEIGETYRVAYKISRASNGPYFNSEWACNKIGVFFTMQDYDWEFDPLQLPGYAHVYSEAIVIDTTDWIEVSELFIADEPYSHIGIGNFFFDSDVITMNIDSLTFGGGAFYYIDDVYVGRENPNSIDETNVDTEISIFPNPSSNIINIDSNGIYKARLYDIRGNAIREFTLQSGRNEFDSKSLANGVYILKIGENASSHLKIVVQH